MCLRLVKKFLLKFIFELKVNSSSEIPILI